MTGRISRCVALIAALAILAGCYETDFPVIEAGKGAEVPGLPGAYEIPDGGEFVIEDRSNKPASNGYVYLLRDNTGEELELFADKLQDDLWLMQIGKTEADGSRRFMFLFLARTDGIFDFRFANIMREDNPSERLAVQMGVEFSEDATPGGEPRFLLKGSRENILAFLRAHPGQIVLEDLMPLVRK